jgi:polar amino acid transport system substrate-binding protein
MSVLGKCGLIALLLLAGSAAADERAVKELVPTGKLRFALVFAPSMSTFFVLKDESGKPRGVTVDLADALAEKLKVPVEYVLFPNSGLVTDALEAGTIDAGFLPPDDERRKRIAFGPLYNVGENTYLATAASGAKTVEDVDRPGMRVIGIANTTTIRSAARALKTTTISPVISVEDALAALRDGKADAFALTRDTLAPYVSKVPGSRVVDGAFQRIGAAIAVGPNKPAALAAVTEFLGEAKASGAVRRAFDKWGFKDSQVAP